MNELRACPQCLRRAWLLSHLAPHIETFRQDFPSGDIAELLSLPDEALCETVTPASAEVVLTKVGAIGEEKFYAVLEEAECWATCRHQDSYPEGLRGVGGAPAALIGHGRAELLGRLTRAETVTVLGTRRATSYGREVARSLGCELAAEGLLVLSGMALGVDACAHRGALEAGTTVAVSACGPDIAYPAAHRSLHRRVAECGVVISELPPGAGAWRWIFSARSRIMAALSGMTVIVEAAIGSGSLMVTERALELGRPVGAVPGPVTSRVSAGPNALLAEGAQLVRDGTDVLRALRGAA